MTRLSNIFEVRYERRAMRPKTPHGDRSVTVSVLASWKRDGSETRWAQGGGGGWRTYNDYLCEAVLHTWVKRLQNDSWGGTRISLPPQWSFVNGVINPRNGGDFNEIANGKLTAISEASNVHGREFHRTFRINYILGGGKTLSHEKDLIEEPEMWITDYIKTPNT